jgi:3-hexulose-6-phosphate synthase/6-phospho-3-hexuloisomerase
MTMPHLLDMRGRACPRRLAGQPTGASLSRNLSCPVKRLERLSRAAAARYSSAVLLDNLTYPVVQLSLDLTSLHEALETAAVGVEAGVDWLEAGTPLLLAHGLRAVEALRARFPDHPIVADLKTMDGGYLEAEMMARAGASLVVVMGRAHEATIRRVVDAGRDFGIKVMGDNLAADDRVACARWMEGLGVDFIVHHIGFDERALIKGLSPLDELDAVVAAVSIPVQAVGGLSIAQAIECPRRGAPLVVIGAPLVIDGTAFRPADGNLFTTLRRICEDIRRVPYQKR